MAAKSAHAQLSLDEYEEDYEPSIGANQPLNTNAEMSYAKKEIAQIKNKQAARKYRDKKKSYIEIIEKQLAETE